MATMGNRGLENQDPQRLTDRQNFPQIPLERAVRMNIVDADMGTIRDPATGRTLSIAEAVNEGIVVVECSEAELPGQTPISPQSAGRSQTLPNRTSRGVAGPSNARKRTHVSWSLKPTCFLPRTDFDCFYMLLACV